MINEKNSIKNLPYNLVFLTKDFLNLGKYEMVTPEFGNIEIEDKKLSFGILNEKIIVFDEDLKNIDYNKYLTSLPDFFRSQLNAEFLN
jgi:hypothetical protein